MAKAINKKNLDLCNQFSKIFNPIIFQIAPNINFKIYPKYLLRKFVLNPSGDFRN
jgi:hypothetical protein